MYQMKNKWSHGALYDITLYSSSDIELSKFLKSLLEAAVIKMFVLTEMASCAFQD